MHKIQFDWQRETSDQKSESDMKVNHLRWYGATAKINNFTESSEPSINILDKKIYSLDTFYLTKSEESEILNILWWFN